MQRLSYKLPVFSTLLVRLIIFPLLSVKSNLAEAHASSLPPADRANVPTTTFYVRRIILEHAQYLSKQAQRKLVAPYVNTFLSTHTIQKLIQDIRAYYLKQGYPTVQVQVGPGQSIQDGTLRLKIIHGFVEQIRLGTNNLRDKLQLATAFPFVQGKPLYLPYLEQGIHQLNTLTSQHANMIILPGKLVGGSIIQISNSVVHPWRMDIGVDNLGEEVPGQLRGKVNLALDNLLGINDNFAFNYSIDKVKQVGEISLLNQAFMSSFSFPFRAYNFNSTYNTSTALTPLRDSYLYKTKSSSTALQVKRIIARHRSHELFLHLGFTRKETASFIEDTCIANQSRKLTSCQGGLSYTGIIGGGQGRAELIYHHGIPLLGANKDSSSLACHAPKAQYKKLNLELFWGRLFRLPKQMLLYYQLQCASQHSQDVLFSSEQLSVGGMERVRGLPNQYAGNQGFFMRHELSLMQLFAFSDLTAPFQLFLGLDWAHILQDASTVALGASTTWLSWSYGCKYNAYGISLDLIYARVLNQGVETKHKRYMNLTLSLHQIGKLLDDKRRTKK